jgi:hypothetical protein
LVLIDYEPGRAPEPGGTLWKSEKSPFPTGNRTRFLGCPSSSPNITRTLPFRLQNVRTGVSHRTPQYA